MNFDDAIRAHAAWKMKLSRYVQQPNGSLKPSDIEVDNRCALGQWIHGEGAKFARIPEYATLKSEHARFHRAAADIVRKADLGHNVSDALALGSNSAFGASSSAVVSAIIALKRKSG
jgi:nitric oxide synthase oxygenase domain/subunit